MNTELLRNHHSTAARDRQKGGSDVTSLVATEHVRKKFSLQESKHCNSVKLLIAAFQLKALFWSAFVAINQIKHTGKVALFSKFEQI